MFCVGVLPPRFLTSFDGRIDARSTTCSYCRRRELRNVAYRGTWAQGVAGSNPVAPTTFEFIGHI
jgi:hypothetical protein